MTYNPYRQPPHDALYGSQYRSWSRDRGRDHYRPREADPRVGTPRASRNTRRGSPPRGADYPGASRIDDDDGYYERLGRRLGRDRYAGVGGPTYGEFDDRFRQAGAELNRERREAAVNYHYDLPRAMPPPRGGGGFDGYVPGYDYPPDPQTMPRAGNPPPTQPYHPHPPRDRSRSVPRRGGERLRKTRSKPKLSFWYVYVGTTDPDGKVIDGYEGYESEP
ncbi:predicted protein [Chaetomium globosum CBS 148.51]|uniref:Uncharacterized protein n=1 Tax=Chaetomium globosum (strain ATCC 6205 / CBS 148.51 / DSM 1962 / NBRC 6347 / NRRL 1970) TaxID=306901 RepID=Q2H3U9_CHAGB|nr:uncharacterized protein CHGG_06666 [Chaetomium globosum CBS 148.51]EAQ90047.1 predicted protein [Chaetomium globosum CBS 148.51]